MTGGSGYDGGVWCDDGGGPDDSGSSSDNGCLLMWNRKERNIEGRTDVWMDGRTRSLLGLLGQLGTTLL